MVIESERISWPEYFMGIARYSAKMSTCLRRHIGAVAVRGKRIIATGFNGQVPGAPHCRSCVREEMNIPSGQRSELCRVVHAEQNLIIQAAIYGISLVGADIYVTTKPCETCLKMLLSLNPGNIFYENDYPNTLFDMIIADTEMIVSVNEDSGFFCITRKGEYGS